eukprot:scaffold8280_cov59-Phaeocystis_antarctica.AAC.6
MAGRVRRPRAARPGHALARRQTSLHLKKSPQKSNLEKSPCTAHCSLDGMLRGEIHLTGQIRATWEQQNIQPANRTRTHLRVFSLCATHSLTVDRAASGSRRRPRGRVRARAARGGPDWYRTRWARLCPPSTGQPRANDYSYMITDLKDLTPAYEGPHAQSTKDHSSEYEGPHATAYRVDVVVQHFRPRWPILSWPCRLRSSRPTYPSPSPVARPSCILLPSAAHP